MTPRSSRGQAPARIVAVMTLALEILREVEEKETRGEELTELEELYLMLNPGPMENLLDHAKRDMADLAPRLLAEEYPAAG